MERVISLCEWTKRWNVNCMANLIFGSWYVDYILTEVCHCYDAKESWNGINISQTSNGDSDGYVETGRIKERNF